MNFGLAADIAPMEDTMLTADIVLTADTMLTADSGPAAESKMLVFVVVP